MANRVKTTLLPPRPGRLKKLSDLRQELAFVYRDTRQGLIPTQDATRLTYILTALRQVIEVEMVEQRLDSLEKIVEQRHR